MHVVIMGCGRVGSSLAQILESRGHTVAVIDQNSDAFRRLPAGFEGRTVAGIGFDRDVLREAGIEQAEAFAAVSSGDNSNILAARVARETFGVESVVARIYDPGRAAVYQRLGIPTVATVRWTADQMLRRLLPEGAETGVGRSDRHDPASRGARDQRVGRPARCRRSRPRREPGWPSCLGSARESCRRRTPSSRRVTSYT